MNTTILKDDPTTTTDPAQLAALARKAHEQKRTKECLALINQLLLCDPGNSEAMALRADVFSDMEHDLSDARVLLADSQSREDGQKYRKAAEIILLKILYLDPSHAEAKALIATARASSAPPVPAAIVEAQRSIQPMGNELRFTAQPEPLDRKPQARNSGIGRKLPALLAAVVLLTAGGFFLYRPHSESLAIAAEAAADKPVPAAAKAPQGTSAPLPKANDASPAVTPPPQPVVTLAAAAPIPAPNVVAAQGFLAVSSPAAAEIYMDGKYLGETPITLQLPAGTQTLEYRHGDLRTTLTHAIKSKETVTARVSFDMTVQINARPWAQVFIDGTPRKPLGQTPLGSVRVPLGSVLAFENPNFPSKSHRVTDTDSSIQVVFP